MSDSRRSTPVSIPTGRTENDNVEITQEEENKVYQSEVDDCQIEEHMSEVTTKDVSYIDDRSLSEDNITEGSVPTEPTTLSLVENSNELHVDQDVDENIIQKVHETNSQSNESKHSENGQDSLPGETTSNAGDKQENNQRDETVAKNIQYSSFVENQRLKPGHRRLARIRKSDSRRHTIAAHKNRQSHEGRVPLELKRQSLNVERSDKLPPTRQSRLPSLQNLGSNIASAFRMARQSVIGSIGKREPESEETKIKSEVDKLWKIRTTLIKREIFGKEHIIQLKALIVEVLELLGRVRAHVREKEIYSDADVEYHAREINSLQLLFHSVLEIWMKMKDKMKELDKNEHKNIILSETMELATDLSSLFGEVMALFLQRFDLNIIPMLRPVHGLYYCIGIHCRFNCIEKDTIYRDGASTVYHGFITAIMSLLRATKVLLKRLKFDDDVGIERRRLVQSTICKFTKDIQTVLAHGLHALSLDEYRNLLHKLGNLCSDAFFTIGKTSGILGSLEMGEGVSAVQPAKLLGNISHCDIVRCAVEDRPEVVEGLTLQEGQLLVSDIFQITGAPFCTSEKILLRFPAFPGSLPPTSMVKVKVKYGAKWTDMNGRVKNNQIEFESKMINAFLAVAGYRGIHREVTTDGFNFVSDDDTRVRISIPKGCYQVPSITKFRLIQMNRLRMQDYKECCKEDSNGILALSDILNVIHDDNLKINKPMLIHLPILHDVDDDHAELVVFERSLEGNLSIWIVNDAIKCEPDGNCYTFRVTNVNNSIALGKVKRKVLKRSKTRLIDEFNLYLGLEHMVNIVTYMDKNLLSVGVVKLWVEIVDKRFSSKIHRRRANQGMFEVPGSRSTDLRMRELDVIKMDLAGSIQKIREIPSEHYSIVFLSTARDNYRSFHVEERKDPRGRQVGIINFLIDTQGENVLLHSATIDVNRYINTLSRVNSSKSDARPHTFGRLTFSRQSRSSRSSGRSVKSTLSYKNIFEEVPVLSHQSLLVLAGAMSVETAQILGVDLGLENEAILNIKTINQPTVLTVFEILWLWRGKQASNLMAVRLIDSLKRIEFNRLANVVAKANRERRYIVRTDLRN